MVKVTYEAPDIPVLKKEGFVADMHFHSAYSYDCQTSLNSIIKQARKLGVHVALTDHNRIGGVVEARRFKEAPIIPSIEICSKEGKEIIPYFYDSGQLIDFYERKLKPLLKEKNPLRSARTQIPMHTLFSFLEEEDCVIHIPHPFAPQPRMSYKFFSKEQLLLRKAHSVEVFNEAMSLKANIAALGWAAQLGKSVVGGSDGHSLTRLGKGVTVTKATSVEEHLNEIKRGKTFVYGKELFVLEKMINYARTAGKSKIQKGVKRSFFPALGLEQL